MKRRRPSKVHFPSAKRYKQAFQALDRRGAIKDHHRRMLAAHYRAENRTVTAGELAKKAGYANWPAANLQYGTLARCLREELHIEHGKWQVYTLADFIRDDDKKCWQWKMRPEVAQSLRELGWV